MLSMLFPSLTSLRVCPHPSFSAECKRLLCFYESLFRVGGIHSCSFNNLGLFFNRLQGLRPQLIEGNGYEARQTSKEQTKMPRFVLEGPRPCKIFFCTQTLCMNYVTKTFLLVSYSVSSIQQLCFAHGQGQKKRTKTYNKELCQVS